MVSKVVKEEEEAFLRTLDKGLRKIDDIITETKNKQTTTINGKAAFELYDTYGFPIDLTLEMAAEKGLEVDHDGFRRLMGEQRDRAKADAKQLGIDRGTVAKYLAAAAPAISTPGSAGDPDSKPAISTTGSAVLPDAKPAISTLGSGVGRQSLCVRWQEPITTWLALGRTAQWVYQELVSEITAEPDYASALAVLA